MITQRLYAPYLNQIKNTIGQSNDRISKGIFDERSFYGDTGLITLSESYDSNLIMADENSGIKKLADLIGAKQVDQTELGNHPDFISIKQTKSPEFHYVISMFIDIKNSTGLFKKYGHAEIFKVTNTIQAAAIHTCKIFGGHIQRLQGDGVFAYFGRKGMGKEDAVAAALNAAAFFSFFVKYELPDAFEEDGVDKIFTRIGIDFGDDKDVMWAVFGSNNCNELTTLSLHTSLAPKMQANAESNGIVVGDNVTAKAPGEASYFSVLKKSNNQIDYIWEDSGKKLYYKQHNFNWQQFLKRYPFIKSDGEGGLLIVSIDELNQELRKKLLQKEIQNTNTSRNLDSKGNVTNENTGIKSTPHKFFTQP